MCLFVCLLVMCCFDYVGGLLVCVCLFVSLFVCLLVCVCCVIVCLVDWLIG